ncbi:MAG: transposase domain-containing protein [Opitutales bacterium]|nr:transposase domain-containing protein [Opitutales bacterium]
MNGRPVRARTAIIYSVLITCRRFGIKQLAYLRDLLNRLPAMSNQDNLDALLPDRWKPPSRARYTKRHHR